MPCGLGHGDRARDVGGGFPRRALYPYYDATVTGLFWGILWGFIDVFAGLFVFGLLYNLFAGKPKEG
ncbi:MAG: hypothetical protein AMS16_05100 [Planctomycetes bacterium DG_58]|nr:MAG: hypothetical protein AMS16_05100 [Planctomycetes bacterium DG_58]